MNRESLEPTAAPVSRVRVGVLFLIAAPLSLCGLCATVFYAFTPLTANNAADSIYSNVVFGSLAALGIGFGSALVWQGLSAWRAHAARPAARLFPPAWFFGGGFVLALVLGAITMAINSDQSARIVAYIFPVWHVLAATFAPLMFVAFAARRLGAAADGRAVLRALAWGALGSTTLALLLEAIIGVIIIGMAVFALTLTPAGAALLEQLGAQVEASLAADDPSVLLEMLRQPIVIAGALFYLALIIPVIEETLKTLVVAFAASRGTRWADALLWGVAAGAGFAIFENALNGGAVLAAWNVTMSLRLGATVMHVATGALMARGWYAARCERRWSQLGLLYVVSVFFHALWNATAIVLSSRTLSVGAAAPLTWDTLAATGIGIALASFQVMLAVFAGAGFVRAVRSASTSL